MQRFAFKSTIKVKQMRICLQFIYIYNITMRSNKGLTKQGIRTQKAQIIQNNSQSNTNSFKRLNFNQAIQSQSSTFYRKYIQIIKKRNLAKFLLKCSHFCSFSTLAEISSSIIMVFLYLKASTETILKLSKFIEAGQFLSDEKQLNFYKKNESWLRFQSQIAKQSALSRKHLNLILEKIKQIYPNVLQDQYFAQECRNENINIQYFCRITRQFIYQSVNNKKIIMQDKQNLKYLLLMSYIVDLKGYQQFCEQLINEQIQKLSNQTIFIKIQQMSEQNLIQKINNIFK